MNRLFLYLVVVSMLSSCGNSDELIETDKIDKVVYSFGDSSVPPPYHRSYDIVATTSSISVVVDSYGDIIAEKEVTITSKQFNGLIDVVNAAKMKNKSKNESVGCTGGTSDYLTLFSSDEVIFEGSTYNCGGDKYGNMEGNIESIKSKLKSMIPNFNALLE
ncbi:MAG: hypothetical protein MK078_00935 [Crocinitomicaceae bacterium]|nr:hypothetical protein [Crocinitomicaceae bacterium]